MRALALLCLACSVTPRAEVPTLDATAEGASVVLVSDSVPRCGGVAVGPHSVVTTLHCLRGESIVDYVDRAAWADGWRTDRAILAMQHPAQDLALLATSEPLDAWAVPGFSDLAAGQSVCWSHHGARSPYQWDCGTVTDPESHTQNDRDLYLDVTETDLPATDGDSGAGLWDRDGRLVGIETSVRDATGRALFVKPDAIVALLRGEKP
jgi:S1-C subfamily serine protease